MSISRARAEISYLPLRLEGTEFQRSVWEALERLEFGQFTSYGELGAEIGRPRVRAGDRRRRRSQPDTDHRRLSPRALIERPDHRVQRGRGNPDQTLAAHARGDHAGRMSSIIIGDDGVPRCSWGAAMTNTGAITMRSGGAAQRDPRALYEKLCLEGFQAGLSWITILRTRVRRFARCSTISIPERVAAMTEADVERLLLDERIIRHRGKIEATITNARRRSRLDVRSPRRTDVGLRATCRVDRDRRTSAEVPAVTAESTAMSKELRKRGLPLRRTDDDVRPDAVDRNGRRPRRRLLSRAGLRTSGRRRWRRWEHYGLSLVRSPPHVPDRRRSWWIITRPSSSTPARGDSRLATDASARQIGGDFRSDRPSLAASPPRLSAPPLIRTARYEADFELHLTVSISHFWRAYQHVLPLVSRVESATESSEASPSADRVAGHRGDDEFELVTVHRDLVAFVPRPVEHSAASPKSAPLVTRARAKRPLACLLKWLSARTRPVVVTGEHAHVDRAPRGRQRAERGVAFRPQVDDRRPPTAPALW